MRGDGVLKTLLENDGPYHDKGKQSCEGHQAPPDSGFVNVDGVVLEISR